MRRLLQQQHYQNIMEDDQINWARDNNSYNKKMKKNWGRAQAHDGDDSGLDSDDSIWTRTLPVTVAIKLPPSKLRTKNVLIVFCGTAAKWEMARESGSGSGDREWETAATNLVLCNETSFMELSLTWGGAGTWSRGRALRLLSYIYICINTYGPKWSLEMAAAIW